MKDDNDMEALRKENVRLKRALVALKANAIYFADEALYPQEQPSNKSEVK